VASNGINSTIPHSTKTDQLVQS